MVEKFKCTGENCLNCVLPDCQRPEINLSGNITFVFVLGKWVDAKSKFAKRHAKDADQFIKLKRPDGSFYYKSLARIRYDAEYHRKKYKTKAKGKDEGDREANLAG